MHKYYEGIKNILLPENILLYKASDCELAVQFKNKELKERFITLLGGIKTFSEDDKLNASKKFPACDKKNESTIYIPAYTTKSGELAVYFPSTNARDKFCYLLQIQPELARTYKNQLPLHISAKNTHESNGVMRLCTPRILHVQEIHSKRSDNYTFTSSVNFVNLKGFVISNLSCQNWIFQGNSASSSSTALQWGIRISIAL